MIGMRTILWLSVTLALMAAVWASRSPPPRVLVEAPLPPGAVILDLPNAAAMLEPCSREGPPRAESGWHPNPSDIAALERALPDAIRARRKRDNIDWSKLPAKWVRQYVGVVHGGRRYIYGNFLPDWLLKEEDLGMEWWPQKPVEICDGGPELFGVEYDVEERRFSHMAFNGVA